MDRVWRDGVITGVIAGSASVLAAMLCGQVERGHALEPMNAVSHMALGDDAAISKGFDPLQTSLGFAGHAAAALSWGVIYQAVFPKLKWPSSLLGATAFTAAVWAVDYRLVPKRYTPGLENVLSGKSLAVVYAALALGFAASSLVTGGEE